MNVRRPQLRWHKHKKTWYMKFGGHFYWCGKDKAVAKAREPELLTLWAENRKRDQQFKRRIAARTGGRRLKVRELHDRFMVSRRAEAKPITADFYQRSLKHFVAFWGEAPCDTIGPLDIQGYREDRLLHSISKRSGGPYARKTVNHEISCIKTMFQWAMNLELIRPVNLAGVRALRLPPPRDDKGYTLKKVRKFLKEADDDLRPWIEVHWLTMARTTEMIRIAQDDGDWPEPWMFRPREAKTFNRVIVFSRLALTSLKHCKPHWSRCDSYRNAFTRQLGDPREDASTGQTLLRRGIGGPHPLRHGAASGLARLGVARVDISLLLGHSLPRVSATYVPADYLGLRKSISKLTL